MTDDELRELARSEHVTLSESVDVEAALEAVHRRIATGEHLSGRIDTGRVRARSVRLRVGLAAGVAAAAALVAGLVVATSGDDRLVHTDTSQPTATVDQPGPPTTPVPTTTSLAPASTEPAPQGPGTSVEADGPASTAAPAGETLLPEYRCVGDMDCTQLAAAPSGILAYDPTIEHLTLLDPTGQHVLVDTPLDEPLTRPGSDGSAASMPFLVAVGPEDVAYFTVSPPDVHDPLRDLIAVPTRGSRAGQLIRIASGLDGSGDSDLVPTPEGLADVGCCGDATVRPEPDAQVFGWIASDGRPTTSTAVHFEIHGYDNAALVRIDPRDGTTVSFELPGVAVGGRSMPVIVATDDGGALMFVFDWLTARDYVVRFSPDDTVGAAHSAQVILPPADTPTVTLLEPAGTAVVRVGDRFVRRTLAELGTPGWDGRLEVDLSGDVWTVSAPGLDEVIERDHPEWATDPMLLARQLEARLGPGEFFAANWDADLQTLTITVSNLLDDSGYAVRFTIALERADDGFYRFASGTYAVQCQPNRGHQDFESRPCS